MLGEGYVGLFVRISVRASYEEEVWVNKRLILAQHRRCLAQTSHCTILHLDRAACEMSAYQDIGRGLGTRERAAERERDRGADTYTKVSTPLIAM